MLNMPGTIMPGTDWGCLKCGGEIGPGNLVYCRLRCGANYHGDCVSSVRDFHCCNPTCRDSWLMRGDYKAIAADVINGSIADAKAASSDALSWGTSTCAAVSSDSSHAAMLTQIMQQPEHEPSFWESCCAMGLLGPRTVNLYVEGLAATRVAKAVYIVLSSLKGEPGDQLVTNTARRIDLTQAAQQGSQATISMTSMASSSATASQSAQSNNLQQYLIEALKQLFENPSSKTLAPIAAFAEFFNTVYAFKPDTFNNGLGKILETIPGVYDSAQIQGSQWTNSSLEKSFKSLLAKLNQTSGGQGIVRVPSPEHVPLRRKLLYGFVAILQIAALILGLVWDVVRHYHPGTFDGPTIGPNPPVPTVGPPPTGEPVEFFITIVAAMLGWSTIAGALILTILVTSILCFIILALFGTWNNFFNGLRKLCGCTGGCCKKKPTGDRTPLLPVRE